MDVSQIETKALRAYGLHTAAAALALENKLAVVDLSGPGSVQIVSASDNSVTEVLVRTKRHSMWQGSFDADLRRLRSVSRVMLVDALDGKVFSFTPSGYGELMSRHFNEHLKKHGGERPRTPGSQHYGLKRSQVEAAPSK